MKRTLFFFTRDIEPPQKLNLIGVLFDENNASNASQVRLIESITLSSELSHLADFIIQYHPQHVGMPEFLKCRYQAGPLAFNPQEMEFAVKEFINQLLKQDHDIRTLHEAILFKSE